MVHTDDLAWWHSRLGWVDLLLTEIIAPLGRGEPFDYRPTRWDERHRRGSIRVPAGLDLVVIEGVGAGRSTLAGSMGAIIWVQSDLNITERRATVNAWPPASSTPAAMKAGWLGVPFQETEKTGNGPISSSRARRCSTTRAPSSWSSICSQGHDPGVRSVRRGTVRVSRDRGS